MSVIIFISLSILNNIFTEYRILVISVLVCGFCGSFPSLLASIAYSERPGVTHITGNDCVLHTIHPPPCFKDLLFIFWFSPILLRCCKDDFSLHLSCLGFAENFVSVGSVFYQLWKVLSHYPLICLLWCVISFLFLLDSSYLHVRLFDVVPYILVPPVWFFLHFSFFIQFRFISLTWIQFTDSFLCSIQPATKPT